MWYLILGNIKIRRYYLERMELEIIVFFYKLFKIIYIFLKN